MSEIVRRAAESADRLEASKELNAYLAYSRETMQRQARELKTPGTLGGITVAVKDNICTLEYPTTCGSRILEGYESPYEATALTRLKAAGGIIACKSNLDEFAMGSSTEHSAYGRCLHPTHPDRVPGGSSGGSATLVAAGAVDAALGSETGGSVRQPAAFCGVVGIKPSYGRVSRHGLVAFGSSLDQIGVFGRTVEMAGRVFETISGHDDRDATSWPEPPLEIAFSKDNLSGVVIGRPIEYFPDTLDDSIRAACDRVLARAREAGATVRDVSLPHADLAIPTYYVIAPAEASSNLARYDGVRYGPRCEGSGADVRELYKTTRGEGFGAEVKRRIIVGTYVLSAGYYDAYYRKAQIARGLIARDFDHVFSSGVDALFTPTTPTTAFKAGERVDDPVAMYLADRFVCSANLAGVPAVSIPIGRSEELPIGGQFMGPVKGEAAMLEVAKIIESLLDPSEEPR